MDIDNDVEALQEIVVGFEEAAERYMAIKNKLRAKYPQALAIGMIGEQASLSMEEMKEVNKALEDMQYKYSLLQYARMSIKKSALPPDFEIVEMEIKTLCETQIGELNTETKKMEVARPIGSKGKPSCQVTIYFDFDRESDIQMQNADGILVWNDLNGTWEGWKNADRFKGGQ